MAEQQQLDWEDAAVLCEELAALSQLGLPWDSSVTESCRTLPGRMRLHADEIGRPIEQGPDLRGAGVDVDRLPRILVAAIDIGVQTGRPGEVLAQLAPLLLRSARWRRTLKLVWIYPTIIVVMGIGLAIAMMKWYVPITREAWQEDLSDSPHWQRLVYLSEHVDMWGPVVIGVVVVLLGGMLWRIYRAPSRMSLPRWVRRSYLTSFFLSVLRMLVQHRVPLDRAIVLAGDLTNDEAIRRDAKVLAARDRLSGSADRSVELECLPHRVGWLLSGASAPERLANQLELLAGEYESRGDLMMVRLRTWLPIASVCIVGGGTVLLLGTTTLFPYYQMLLKVME